MLANGTSRIVIALLILMLTCGSLVAARQEIRDGISAFMHFKMRSMDRWTQTPNLVFKPTSIVAFAGLAIQQREVIDWGLYRKPQSRIGGYFPVINNMLTDGGPWHEAPTYPFTHTDIYCIGMVSRYRALYDGKDWWTAKAPSGGSPKGLMDYYIDTAYPIEHTGYGPGQIRIVTYGDGATNAKHDLFLVNPAGAAIDGTKALVAAYNASGDPRPAAFAAMIPNYKPTLIDRRPLVDVQVDFVPVGGRALPGVDHPFVGASHRLRSPAAICVGGIAGGIETIVPKARRSPPPRQC